MEKAFIEIHWTSRDQAEAEHISRGLVEKKLIACASIIPSVKSIFIWDAKLEVANETKVIFKTIAEHFDAICAYIIENGHYSVPEILQIPITKGSPSYLDWVQESTNL